MTETDLTVKMDEQTAQIVTASIQALDILIGLTVKNYPRDRIGQFIRECIEFEQYDLLENERADGVKYLDGTIGSDTYAELVGMLAVHELRARAGKTGDTEKPEIELVYDPAIAEEYRAEQAAKEAAAAAGETWNGGNVKRFAEIAEKLPEEATVEKAPDVDAAKKASAEAEAKKQARKAATRTAGKKTAAQARKKATGAADGK